MSMMIAGFPVLLLNAQDGNISQIQAEARTVSRTPEGDRSHYGLWAKDLMKNSKAYYAYRQHDAHQTVLYGDSALLTGFDTPELFFYLADSYEQLGDDDSALKAYQQAKAKGFPAGAKALSEFKKRQKARKKALKNK